MAEDWRKLTGKQIFEQYRKSDRRWTWGIWVSLGLAVILAVAAWLEGSISMGCIGAFALFVALVCFIQERAVLIESVHRYKELQFGSSSKSEAPAEPAEPAPRPQMCLGYRVDPEAVLPITTPRRHWVEWEAWVEEKRGVPVFARV